MPDVNALINIILEGADVRSVLTEAPEHIEKTAKSLDDYSEVMKKVSDVIANYSEMGTKALENLNDSEFDNWSKQITAAWRESVNTDPKELAKKFENFSLKLSELSGRIKNFYKES